MRGFLKARYLILKENDPDPGVLPPDNLARDVDALGFDK
jgi:hypothetical protein